ncbi:thiosulfate sulfurtransferase GlpE [Musicola keenii]|uniref:thiosulfate sulfurtransferase GlpE n=1 Tax=Musicola keenii TaxID=2884250 RepID=UPI0017811FFB|nr:thiosulfate sulfurtransferase GlpE [Musicola keenii]
MEQFEAIDIEQAYQRWQQGNVLVDIRDLQSFGAAHVPGAIHLTNETLSDFVRGADLEQPVLVMCYHGISSRNAAQYLISLGFDAVYSVDGGFEAWRQRFPQEVAAG